jgi:hypothetical protein
MLSQLSVEHDNNYWVNCVKSEDCRQTLAGEARTKAGYDTYLVKKEIYEKKIFNDLCTAESPILSTTPYRTVPYPTVFR